MTAQPSLPSSTASLVLQPSARNLGTHNLHNNHFGAGSFAANTGGGQINAAGGQLNFLTLLHRLNDQLLPTLGASNAALPSSSLSQTFSPNTPSAPHVQESRDRAHASREQERADAEKREQIGDDRDQRRRQQEVRAEQNAAYADAETENAAAATATIQRCCDFPIYHPESVNTPMIPDQPIAAEAAAAGKDEGPFGGRLHNNSLHRSIESVPASPRGGDLKIDPSIVVPAETAGGEVLSPGFAEPTGGVSLSDEKLTVLGRGLSLDEAGLSEQQIADVHSRLAEKQAKVNSEAESANAELSVDQVEQLKARSAERSTSDPNTTALSAEEKIETAARKNVALQRSEAKDAAQAAAKGGESGASEFESAAREPAGDRDRSENFGDRLKAQQERRSQKQTDQQNSQRQWQNSEAKLDRQELQRSAQSFAASASQKVAAATEQKWEVGMRQATLATGVSGANSVAEGAATGNENANPLAGLTGGGGAAKSSLLSANKTAAEATRTPLPPQVLTKVAAALRQAPGGDSTMKLHLDPVELGKLSIEISFKEGVMSAKLKAESNQTKTLLQDGLESLRARLAEHGISVEKLNVELGTQSDFLRSDSSNSQENADRRGTGSGSQDFGNGNGSGQGPAQDNSRRSTSSSGYFERQESSQNNRLDGENATGPRKQDDGRWAVDVMV